MMTTKISEEKLLRKFLKERKLTTAFNRFKQIKRKKVIRLSIDGIRKQVVVFKKKDKTIIADFKTLKTISTTKRFNTRNIKQGFKGKEVFFKKRGKKVSKIVKKLKFAEIERIPLKNFYAVTRGTALRKKVGKLVLNITFFKGKRSITAQGASRQLKDLSDRTSKDLAFNEAFMGALSKISFSYTHYKINWVHYDYFFPRGR